MAWTTPKTWTAEDALTAAELNTYIRDNQLELGPNQGANGGRYLVTDGKNSVDAKLPETSQDDSVDTTTSTTPVALGGPSLSITHTGTLLIFFSARMRRLSGTGIMSCAPHVVGAGLAEARIGTAIRAEPDTFMRFSGHVIHYGLPPGTDTIELRYWIASGEAEYGNRNICVWPL